MRCEACRGTGWVRHALPDPLPVAEEAQRPGQPPVFIEITAVHRPCRECGGSGWAHCCEGERPG